MKCSLSHLVFSRSIPLIILASSTALVGCGKNSQVIRNLSVSASTESGDLMVEMDAQLMQAQFSLPSVTLPLLDPRNSSRKLGELETKANQIIIRVNATEAARLSSVDGSKLPNGASIPVNLNGSIPIGIPVGGSNSMVYLAASDEQLMLGAAVTIQKTDRATSPFSIFLPVQLNPSLTATGGMFFGTHQGIGVFAVQALPSNAPSASRIELAGIASSASDNLRASAKSVAKVGRMSVRTEASTNAKLQAMDRAVGGFYGTVRIK